MTTWLTTHSPVLALHASAVATPAGVLLFLGHAGAGKSTICRLMSARATPLADDAVYLFRDADHHWRVADASARAFAGPLSAPDADALTGKPLRAIFRLYQSPTVKLALASQPEICRHLTDALFEIGWQQRIDGASQAQLFGWVADVARRYPAARLHFTLTNETTELVSAYLSCERDTKWRGTV